MRQIIKIGDAEFEVTTSIKESATSLSVFACAGLIWLDDDGRRLVKHRVRQDFAKLYNKQPRPARLTAKFKSTLLDAVDASTVIADAVAYYA